MSAALNLLRKASPLTLPNRIAVLLTVALVGCGVKPTVDAGTGGGGGITGTGGGSTTGGGTGGGTGTGGGGAVDAGVDAGVSMGTTCANAIPTFLGDSQMGKIDVAGKKVFYKFSADAGDILDLSTTANPMDANNKLDTALKLYDATGAMTLASIDDAYPRLSTDSEMYYRVVTPGTYCVSIEDWSSWAGEPAVARPADTYKLDVHTVSRTASTSNFDTEANDMASSAQVGKLAMGTGFAFGVIFGDLASGTDVDVYKFTVPAGLTTVSIDLAPLGVPSGAGSNGYGSGLGRVAVRVLEMSGTTVLGAWNTTAATYATTPDSITVPVTPGSDVLVSIERPTGAVATANDFYVATVSLSTDNPVEMADATNGVLATAEVLPLTVDTTNPKVKQGFILGTIGAADTDFYSIAVLANDAVSVACGGLRTGSGLIATYELQTSTGTALQSETETALADIYWGTGTSASKPSVTAPAAGTLAFKVTGTQDATNTGNWYRCGIVVTTP